MDSAENQSTNGNDISDKERDTKCKRDDYLESLHVLRSAREERDERSITIEHLPSSTNKEDLTKHYASYGEIDCITIVSKKGLAHVCFSTTEEAKRASSVYFKGKKKRNRYLNF